MVIGAFFSETGNELLRRLGAADGQTQALSEALVAGDDWSRRGVRERRRRLADHDWRVCLPPEALIGLRAFLVEKRPFLLGLLENPNLLEHESFTDVLWAVFHLTEEIACRKDLDHLDATDAQHLSGDMARAYRATVFQWLDYMQHLKSDYPYLFSLAVRMNPFNPRATAEVRQD